MGLIPFDAVGGCRISLVNGNGGFPLTLTVTFTAGQHNRAACDHTLTSNQLINYIMHLLPQKEQTVV